MSLWTFFLLKKGRPVRFNLKIIRANPFKKIFRNKVFDQD